MRARSRPFVGILAAVRKRSVLRFTVLLASLLVCVLGSYYYLLRPTTFPIKPGTDVLAFTTDERPGSQIYVMSTDGAYLARLTYLVAQPKGWWPAFLNPYLKLVNNQQPQPAADGQGIVFLSDLNHSSAFYQLRLDGTGLSQLPSPLSDNVNAARSVDGQSIAFPTEQWDLAVVNSDGSGEQCLTCGQRLSVGRIVWSPDGRRLVFEVKEQRGTNLYVINRDGTGLKRLTATSGVLNANPAWSPDGQRLAFRSNRDGLRTEIYL